MEPLPPLPPLPPLQGTADREEPSERRRPAKTIPSWATVIALLGALAVGILHGVGSKIFDAAWHAFTGHG